MKKLLFLLVLSIVPNTFADWEEIVDDLIEKEQEQEIKIINESFQIEQFTTKEDFEEFLSNKLYDKIIDYCKNYYYYPIRRMYRPFKGRVLEKSLDIQVQSLKEETLGDIKENSFDDQLDYGKTNLQKQNVDEPEIIKLTKDYIAYYNKSQGKIYIIASPVDGNAINLDKVKILDTIKIPKRISNHSVKLFFVNNQLIVIGTRYSMVFGGYITDLVFYKIKDGKARFHRFYDVKGNFVDARIINNKVYLITNYNFGNTVKSICPIIIKPIENKLKRINEDFDKEASKLKDYDEIRELKKQTEEKIRKTLEEGLNKVSKEEILKKIKKGLLQKSVDIVYDKNAKFKYKGKIYPLKIKLVNSPLNNILFIPTDFDNLNIYNLNFNLVNIVDLDTGKNPNQYIIFGNIQNGVIHATEKSLYLVNRYYKSYRWKCPVGVKCILPYYPRGYFSLIYKFNLDGFNLNYVNNQIVPGQPINQYSMDEDKNGNFRIFTKHFYPKRATNLYVFDENLHLVGKIQNIAEGEDFKSSRFIEDKAYLVTFKATDPLFAIDLADIKNPKILGALKIPGYSLYLHPLKQEGSVQYLLGIGQEAEEVYGDWSLPKNIKIDIYKIDYSKKVRDFCKMSEKECKEKYGDLDYIYVEQEFSYILGNEKKVKNGGSYTPVFDNPRAFVYDKQNQILYLPVYLVEDIKEQRCNIRYRWENGQKIEDGERCYVYDGIRPYFIGVKGLKIDYDEGIKEVMSKNYIDYYDSTINQWKYKKEDHRVSYYRIGNDLAVFEINNRFMDIFKGAKSKLIEFTKILKKKPSSDEGSKNTPPKQCFYEPPKPGTITCQRYCGVRWVLRNGKCERVVISAACSCPGFDTKSQCEENCLKK